MTTGSCIAQLQTSPLPEQAFAFADSRASEPLRLDVPGLPRVRPAEAVRVRCFAVLFAADVLCIGLAFMAAGVIWLGSPLHYQASRALALVLPVFIAIAVNNRSYSTEALERPALGLTRAIRALVYSCAIGVAALFYLKLSEEFSRAVFAIGSILSVLALGLARAVLGNVLGRLQHWTFSNRLVIVDGVPITPHRGDTVVFADQLGLYAGSDDPLLRSRLGALVAPFDSVVLACPPDRRKAWSHSLKGSATDVEVLMPELTLLGAVELRTLHGERTLVVSSSPMNLGDRTLKRALDLAVAGSLLLLLIPLMLAIAIAVKVDSRGPIFFRQQRLGQNNRIFSVLKFRSMQVELTDAAGSQSASVDDQRVTRIGRFIRRTSLDELPQLLNVVAGDMSIVGPRPHALGSTAEDQLFWQIDGRYFQRHSIKPGITGLAQIRGFRGATDRRHDLTNRLQSDLEYVSGWTIWRDLKIIAATCGVLVHPRAF